MTILTLGDEDDSLVAADLMRCGQFLSALEVAGTSRESKVVREALTLAAIVSYCRPFLRSFDGSGKRRPWIPEELVNDLPAPLQAVHRRIIASRNEAWAHTDWKAHSPQATPGDGRVDGVISRNPWVPLEPREISEFKTLRAEVMSRLQPASIRDGGAEGESKDLVET